MRAHWLVLIACLGGRPGAAADLAVNLQLTAKAAVSAGIVPGRAYRVVYAGSVAGSLAGEYVHALSIEPETPGWPAAGVPWDSLRITTPRGSFVAELLSARLVRSPAAEVETWSGSGTWRAVGGTGRFAGATGRGTLALAAQVTATGRPEVLQVVGALSLDSAAPAIKIDAGTAKKPRLGPNGRLAIEYDVSDGSPSSGLRLVTVQGRNAALVAVNNEPAGRELPWRYPLREGLAVKRLILLFEALEFGSAEVQVAVTDWAGNAATK